MQHLRCGGYKSRGGKILHLAKLWATASWLI